MSLPARMGKYFITDFLGRGGMGEVYLALDPNIKRQVAVKAIQVEKMEPPELREVFRKRLLREAQICGGLNHPNIVTIHEMSEEAGRLFFVMEYVYGSSLNEYLERGGRPDRSFVEDALSQICAALDYAHGKGVVHRDIKPQNIMISKEGTVKILDFGIARMSPGNVTAPVTTELFIGTPEYASPEQKRQEHIDHRSDIYSLGVVIHELLTGKRPKLYLPTEHLMEFGCRQESGPNPDAKGHASALAAVFQKTFQNDPERRYPTAGIFGRAVIRGLHAAGLPPKAFRYEITGEAFVETHVPCGPFHSPRTWFEELADVVKGSCKNIRKVIAKVGQVRFFRKPLRP